MYAIMTMAQFRKLKTYLAAHSSSFPKLVPALKSLSEFVGHEDIKETVAKMVLFFISQCAQNKPLRRSKRKRKQRGIKPKRRRISSTTSEEEEEDPDFEPGDDAKMALIALLTHSLQAGAEDSSDSEDEYEDPPFVLKIFRNPNIHMAPTKRIHQLVIHDIAKHFTYCYISDYIK